MIRAYISEDFPADAVKIAVVRQPEDGRPEAILRVIDNSPRLRWEAIGPDNPAIEPTMMLHDDEARALLESLTRHFQGAEDTRALRRDYDNERARVDGLTAALIDVAQTLAHPSPASYEFHHQTTDQRQQRDLLKRLSGEQDIRRGG
jgi:hypothetical protein